VNVTNFGTGIAQKLSKLGIKDGFHFETLNLQAWITGVGVEGLASMTLASWDFAAAKNFFLFVRSFNF